MIIFFLPSAPIPFNVNSLKFNTSLSFSLKFFESPALNKKPVLSLIIVSLEPPMLLATIGLIYSWNLLTPLLLEYLASDAQYAGLSTEWTLSSFVGFIISLCLASAIGFQAPLITLLSLNSGAIERKDLISYRKHIWFITFVLGAAFSPPDPLSLFLVSVPIILLFEAALVIDLAMGGNKGED